MYRIIGLSLLPVAATPAFAQTAPEPNAAAIAPSDVIVTAARAPLAADRIASAVTVLDKVTIDRSQAISLSDLLARTPGLSVARTGGFGSQTSLFIRGAQSEQTVVVIDGVKLNDPSSPGAGYDAGNLLLGDAQRVEILRGPQSVLWGSQAIGGVVSIVTALPDQPLAGTVDVEAGSRGTVQGRAGIGGRSERVTWRLAGQAFTTDGVSAIAPRFGGVDRDGYHNYGGSGRVEVALTEGLSADFRGYYTDSKVGIDNSFLGDTPEYSRNAEWLGYAGLNNSLLDDRLKNRIAVTYTNTNRDLYDPRLTPRRTNHFVGINRRLEYQGSFAIQPGWDLIFGAEQERASFRSSSAFEAERGVATLHSLYAQLNATLVKGLTLTGGARYDHHSRFGGNWVFDGGAAWALHGGDTVLRASYTEGFKAPSLYQLYSAYGNVALRPETARGWDAGVQRFFFSKKVNISATWFQRNSRNLINFNTASTPTRPFGFYDNVDKARARGIELSGAAKLDRLTLNANYSWIDSEDRSAGANFGQPLLRRPHHLANGEMGYAWGFGLQTGVAVRWSGKSLDSNFPGTVTLASYTLVDVRAELPLSKALTVFGRVENLFNEHYETVYRYSTLGRSAYGGVRARF